MSNIDKERERIIRLKNYVNQISISSQPLKYDLINEIENCKITNTNEIKNHIEEFENKAKKKSDLIKIVNENHHLHCKLYNNIDFIYNLVDNTEYYDLKDKINNSEIKTKEELEKEIQTIEIRLEKNKQIIERRKQLRNIVNENERLNCTSYHVFDSASYFELKQKIDSDEIVTEEELEKEIQIIERRKCLREIVDENYYLDILSYQNLLLKIEHDEIMTKEELLKEMQKEEIKIDYEKFFDEEYYLDATSKKKLFRISHYLYSKRQWNKKVVEEEKKSNLRKKLIKIVIDNNLDYASQRKLISKINKEEITAEEKLKKEISEEKKNET